jgi:GGDEF domain-containing protein
MPALLARVHAAVAELAPCSLGAACYPDDGPSADRIIAAADRAMYADKRRAPDPPARGPAVLKPA